MVACIEIRQLKEGYRYVGEGLQSFQMEKATSN